MVKQEEQQEISQKVAIIGFWQLNRSQEWDCYYHFYVPNPFKREVRRNDEHGFRILDVLYTGLNGEIFFFF